MYHFLASLTEPLTLGILGALVTTILLWRRRRGRRRRLMVLTIILLLLSVSCTNVVGYLAIGSLEWRYPADTPLPDKADAIVVLSSGMHVLNKSGTLVELDPTSMIRCVKAAEVYHHAGPCLVVVSGGKVKASDLAPPIALAMKEFLIRLNVNPDDILVEGHSRTTYENAVNTLDKIEKRGFDHIVLVTDACHLFRAQRCFEALDCPVIPVGCDYRATIFPSKAKDFVPSTDGVMKLRRASHEWIGILWYWLRGRLS